MKFTIATTIAVGVASATAFVPSATFVSRKSATAMKMSSPDATDLIKEATAISQKFGKNSPEARLAWEAVEEVNAADNR